MERREFLRRSALVAGAAAATGVVGWHATASAAIAREQLLPTRSILDGAPSDSGIDTVVVVMMENRSFDSFLGWLADDDGYLERGHARYGAGFSVEGQQHLVYPAPDGRLVRTAHYPERSGTTNIHRGCGHNDPGHSWDAGRAERDGGFLAGGSGNDEFALSTWRGADLPVYQNLAHRFVVCDRWHAAVMGPTYPNREYLFSAQSGGHRDNFLPIAEGGFKWDAIFDRLLAAGVPVRDYASDVPPIFLFTRGAPLMATIDDYYTDCAAGRLAPVSYVDPKFLEPGESDDHPLADFRAGQAFIRDTFKAFVESPHWERGLFIVLYDEWGGFFDHVPPPVVPDVRASVHDEDNFGQVGFRIPAFVASPRALPGFVDHTRYDHTSIIRFLEWRFLGAPPRGPGSGSTHWWLTTRDRYANNAGRALSSDVFDPDPRFDLDVHLDPPTPPCAPAGAAATDDFDRPFLQAVESGYLERVAPSVMRRLNV
jgi:phospholipase C